MPLCARPSFFQIPRTLFRRRGATLVELAIVLAVVGILMGGMLIPMRALEERRQLREETRRMERVRDAIVGYALRHRTKARTVEIMSGYFFGYPKRFGIPFRFHFPAGRPYLPCPDWDGDGFEDRLPQGPDGFIQGIEVKPDLAVTMTIWGTMSSSLGGPRYGQAHWAGASPGYLASVAPYGECVVPRGAVPWRTLGVPPTDGWGNRHTYFADPLFSNAIFGFDRQTIADIYDQRIPSIPDYLPETRNSRDLYREDGLQTREKNFSTSNTTRNCPVVICDGQRSNDCLMIGPSLDNVPSSSCGWDEEAKLILKAGAVAQGDIHSETPGGKFFAANTVTDGLPFVLVSHGPNGLGAVNHWATMEDPIALLGAQSSPGLYQSPICNWDLEGYLKFSMERGFEGYLVPHSNNLDEVHQVFNAIRLAPGHALDLHSNDRCPLIWMTASSGTHSFRLGPSFFFIWEPPETGDRRDFDDMLLWMTREELSVAIPGRISPLPRMIIPYFP